MKVEVGCYGEILNIWYFSFIVLLLNRINDNKYLEVCVSSCVRQCLYLCAILPCEISSSLSGVADLIDELMSSDGETEFYKVLQRKSIMKLETLQPDLCPPCLLLQCSPSCGCPRARPGTTTSTWTTTKESATCLTFRFSITELTHVQK